MYSNKINEEIIHRIHLTFPLNVSGKKSTVLWYGQFGIVFERFSFITVVWLTCFFVWIICYPVALKSKFWKHFFFLLKGFQFMILFNKHNSSKLIWNHGWYGRICIQANLKWGGKNNQTRWIWPQLIILNPRIYMCYENSLTLT